MEGPGLRWFWRRDKMPRPDLAGVVDLDGLGRLGVVVNDFLDGSHHGERLVGLEDVAAHVDSGSTALDGVVAEFECLELGELFTTGDYDGDGAGGDNVFEAFGVVGLDDGSTVLGANAGSESEVAGVAGHVLTDSSHAHDGDAVFVTNVNETGEVGDGGGLGGGIANGDHGCHGGSVHGDGVLLGDENVVVHLGEDCGAGVCAETNGLGVVSRDAGAEHAAAAHETVGFFGKRSDIEVDALKTGSGSHEESVVEGKHHGASGLAVEDAGHAVLDAP